VDLGKLKRYLGKWSYYCLIATVFLLAIFTGFNPLSLFTDIPALLSGSNVMSQKPIQETIIIVLQQTAVLLAIGLTLALLVRNIVGKDNIKAAFDPMKLFEKGPHLVYLTVFLEELITRQILLGWLRSYLGGGLFVTILFILIGNALFALPHIFNHEKGHRKAILILPQLILGLVLSLIFLKYGFWITLLVHLSYDFVLFAVIKVRVSFIENVICGAYWLVVGVTALFILNSMGVGLNLLAPWLTTTAITPLSLTVGQLTILLVFLTAVFGFVANLFIFDETSTIVSIFREHPVITTASMMVTPLIYVSLTLAIDWILGIFHIDPYSKAMLIIMIFLLAGFPKSGSAMANLWFTGTPFTFFYVFVALTSSFWNAVLIIFVLTMMSLIPVLINANFGDLSKLGEK